MKTSGEFRCFFDFRIKQHCDLGRFQVKKSIRRQLAARKLRTMKRIDKANWSGQSPMLTCPDVQYELAEKTQTIAWGELMSRNSWFGN